VFLHAIMIPLMRYISTFSLIIHATCDFTSFATRTGFIFIGYAYYSSPWLLIY